MSLLLCYEVLCIHDIDAICSFETSFAFLLQPFLEFPKIVDKDGFSPANP